MKIMCIYFKELGTLKEIEKAVN